MANPVQPIGHASERPVADSGNVIALDVSSEERMSEQNIKRVRFEEKNSTSASQSGSGLSYSETKLGSADYRTGSSNISGAGAGTSITGTTGVFPSGSAIQQVDVSVAGTGIGRKTEINISENISQVQTYQQNESSISSNNSGASGVLGRQEVSGSNISTAAAAGQAETSSGGGLAQDYYSGKIHDEVLPNSNAARDSRSSNTVREGQASAMPSYTNQSTNQSVGQSSEFSTSSSSSRQERINATVISEEHSFQGSMGISGERIHQASPIVEREPKPVSSSDVAYAVGKTEYDMTSSLTRSSSMVISQSQQESSSSTVEATSLSGQYSSGDIQTNNQNARSSDIQTHSEGNWEMVHHTETDISPSLSVSSSNPQNQQTAVSSLANQHQSPPPVDYFSNLRPQAQGKYTSIFLLLITENYV